MQSDILQKFLDQGLLDLGEGTDKFAYLKAAAEDLAKTLKENRRILVRSSLVLLGGRFVEGEPVIGLCQGAIKEHWPTYRSRFPSDTSQLFRAALFQAVAQVTEDTDCSYAAIVLYTASSALPYLTTEREDKTFREFLLRLGERVESEATLAWARLKASSWPDLKYGDNVSLVQINVKWLTDALKSATGPTAGGASANPAWPSASQEWLDHFGKASAEAINTAVTSVLKDLVPKIVAQARNDDGKVVDVVKDMFKHADSDNLRADLLYWKEALFSPTKKLSYRQLSPDTAVYWIAHDLHLQVPRFHPHSVEFFLRETVRSALGETAAMETPTLEQFCIRLQEFGGITSTLAPEPSERLTLLEAAQSATGGRLVPANVAERIGITAETLVPRVDLAVWLFRDFQARRLAGGE